MSYNPEVMEQGDKAAAVRTGAVEAIAKAAAVWAEIVGDVGGITVDSDATARAVARAVQNRFVGLTVRELRTFAGMAAMNLLAATGEIDADAGYFQHLFRASVTDRPEDVG